MDRLFRIRVITFVWLLIPLGLLVAAPAWLRDVAHEAGPAHWGIAQWIGAWLMINGVGLMGWCVYLFNVVGQGTPVPWEAPQRFVLSGPYRFVRNPMALGALMLLAGQALAFQSRTGGMYTLIAGCAAWALIRCVEEPQLRRRYGQNYADYCREVPRWMPRLPERRKSN